MAAKRKRGERDGVQQVVVWVCDEEARPGACVSGDDCVGWVCFAFATGLLWDYKHSWPML